MKKVSLFFLFFAFLVKIQDSASELIVTTNSSPTRVLCIDWKKEDSVSKKEIICTGNSDKSVFFRNLTESIFLTVNSAKPIYAVDLDYGLEYLAIGIQLPSDKKTKVEGKYAIKIVNFPLLEENTISEKDLLGHNDLITTLHWPKKSFCVLVSGSLDGDIKIWDTVSYKCVSTLSFDQGLKDKPAVWCVQVSNKLLKETESSEQIYLAAGFTNGCIDVWKLGVKYEGITEVEVLDEILLKSNDGFVRSLDWSKDDKFIVAGYYNGDIRIWEPQKKGRKCIFHVKGHCGAVNGIQFFSDNEHLISAGIDGKVKVWHLKKGESEIVEALKYEDTNIPIQINCMELSPDNLSILVGASEGIIIVDLRDILLRDDFSGVSNHPKKSEKEIVSVETNK